MVAAVDPYEALRVSDHAVAKALGISEVAQIARAEVRLRGFMLAKWNELVDQAVKRASAMARAGKSARSITAAIHEIMGKWPAAVLPKTKAEIAAIYRLAKIAGWRKATKQTKAPLVYDTPNLTELIKAAPAEGFSVLPSFGPIDEGAIAALGEQQTFWIGDHYSNNLGAAIASTTSEAMVAAGKKPAVAGELIRERIRDELGRVRTPAGFHGSAAQYFEGLAANAVTVARAYGQVTAFDEVGVTRYVIVNPIDERTCPVCSHMDGKTFTVPQGKKQMEAELAADSPAAIKKAHPWLTPAELKTVSPKAGPASLKDSASLADAGVSLPPFHFRCLLPGAEIQGRINGASRARYSGKALELVTFEGRRLSVTPNHPILTANGFIAAGQLRKGDQLVCNRSQPGIDFLRSTTKRNEYEKPTSIENVFRAFLKSGGSAFIPPASDDFHSEATRFYGNVEVVGAYRELLIRWKALQLQQICEGILKCAASAQSLVHGMGALDLGFERFNSSSRCGPSRGALPFDGFSALLGFLPFQEFSLGSASQIDTTVVQQPGNGGAGSTQLASQLIDRHPRQVLLDKIVSVDEFDFCGHVYDLQSPLGWVVAQDIYISNCRCAVDVS